MSRQLLQCMLLFLSGLLELVTLREMERKWTPHIYELDVRCKLTGSRTTRRRWQRKTGPLVIVYHGYWETVSKNDHRLVAV